MTSPTKAQVRVMLISPSTDTEPQQPTIIIQKRLTHEISFIYLSLGQMKLSTCQYLQIKHHFDVPDIFFKYLCYH